MTDWHEGMGRTQDTRTEFVVECRHRTGRWKPYYPTNARCPGRPPYKTLDEAVAALDWTLTEGHATNRRFAWRVVECETTTTKVSVVQHTREATDD